MRDSVAGVKIVSSDRGACGATAREYATFGNIKRRSLTSQRQLNIRGVVSYAVKRCAKPADIVNLAPHDLRRSCARLCHLCGGELEQIQFLLGQVSVQTTERYIGRDQIND